jgi:hypothetical protein
MNIPQHILSHAVVTALLVSTAIVWTVVRS